MFRLNKSQGGVLFRPDFRHQSVKKYKPEMSVMIINYQPFPLWEQMESGEILSGYDGLLIYLKGYWRCWRRCEWGCLKGDGVFNGRNRKVVLEKYALCLI